MISIIDLMNEMGYSIRERGVCCGHALMAQRAHQYGRYVDFENRINYLVKLEPNTLAGLIKQVEDKGKNLNLTDDDKILLTIKTFFFQIYSYQRPNELQNFLGIKGPFFSQANKKEIDSLMYGNEDGADLLPLGPYKNFLLFTEVDNNRLVLREFLNETKDLSLGILLHHIHHVVHLFYDNKNVCWKLTNSWRLTSYRDCDSLMNGLESALKFTNNHVLSVHVFIDDLALTTGAIKKLDKISKQSINIIFDNGHVNSLPLLFLAAKYNHINLVERLVKDLETDVNSSEMDCETPLSVAAGHGYDSVVSTILTRKNVEINKATLRNKNTPLFRAAAKGHIDVVNSLLQYPGIDPNITSRDGYTPLYTALYYDHIEVVMALLNAPQIDILLAPKNGETVFDLVKKKQNPDITRAIDKITLFRSNANNNTKSTSSQNNALYSNHL